MVDTNTHKPLKLMDRLRQKIRFKHYSLSTERVYSQWVRQYILFHGKQHPKDLGEQDIVRFLNYLANDRNVATFLLAHVQGKKAGIICMRKLYRALLVLPLKNQGC